MTACRAVPRLDRAEPAASERPGGHAGIRPSLPLPPPLCSSCATRPSPHERPGRSPKRLRFGRGSRGRTLPDPDKREHRLGRHAGYVQAAVRHLQGFLRRSAFAVCGHDGSSPLQDTKPSARAVARLGADPPADRDVRIGSGCRLCEARGSPPSSSRLKGERPFRGWPGPPCS
jgi:hypothetical protein